MKRHARFVLAFVIGAVVALLVQLNMQQGLLQCPRHFRQRGEANSG